MKLRVPCSEVYTKESDAPPFWVFTFLTAGRKDIKIERGKVVVEFENEDDCERAAEDLRLSGFTVERGV